MDHYPGCERTWVFEELRKRLNVSVWEVASLLGEGGGICHCWERSRLGGTFLSGDRDKKLQDAIGEVLRARSEKFDGPVTLNVPYTEVEKRVLKFYREEEQKSGRGKENGDSGQVIRIDFRARKKIVD